MKESDYIIVTNLAKLRIVEHSLRTVMQDGVVTDSQRREIIATIGLWIRGLEEKTDKLVKG